MHVKTTVFMWFVLYSKRMVQVHIDSELWEQNSKQWAKNPLQLRYHGFKPNIV